MRIVDNWIDHGEAFSGRKAGAIAPETKFLERLTETFPHENTQGLWWIFRAVAANPDDRKNPTAGTCPFKHKFDRGGRLVVLKREKPYPFGTFRNALSVIRRRRANALK